MIQFNSWNHGNKIDCHYQFTFSQFHVVQNRTDFAVRRLVQCKANKMNKWCKCEYLIFCPIIEKDSLPWIDFFIWIKNVLALFVFLCNFNDIEYIVCILISIKRYPNVAQNSTKSIIKAIFVTVFLANR